MYKKRKNLRVYRGTGKSDDKIEHTNWPDAGPYKKKSVSYELRFLLPTMSRRASSVDPNEDAVVVVCMMAFALCSGLARILFRVDDVLRTSFHLFAVLGLCGLLLNGVAASGIFSSTRKIQD